MAATINAVILFPINKNRENLIVDTYDFFVDHGWKIPNDGFMIQNDYDDQEFEPINTIELGEKEKIELLVSFPNGGTIEYFLKDLYPISVEYLVNNRLIIISIRETFLKKGEDDFFSFIEKIHSFLSANITYCGIDIANLVRELKDREEILTKIKVNEHKLIRIIE